MAEEMMKIDWVPHRLAETMQIHKELGTTIEREQILYTKRALIHH